MDSAKKQHERFQLDRFLEIQGIPPTCIHALDPPDFLIGLDGRQVGIEVTRLFIRSRSKGRHRPEGKLLLQDLESITEKIASTARKIYFDAGSPLVMSTIWFEEESIANQIVSTGQSFPVDACNSPVLSEIWFSSRTTADKVNGVQIAELIADQIRSMSPLESQKAIWRSSEDENEDRPLSEWVAIIHAEGVPEFRDAQWKDRFARWTVAGPGLVAPLTPKRLQEEIDKKAKKINECRKHACTEEIWLLIVVDRTRPSQGLRVPPDFPLDSVSSRFARTFYCDFVHKEVIEITNKAKTSGEN